MMVVYSEMQHNVTKNVPKKCTMKVLNDEIQMVKIDIFGKIKIILKYQVN